MKNFSQGDIVKISGYKNCFLVVSKNAFIKATNVFRVCPILQGIPEGPLHIGIVGKVKETGVVVCEQIKLIVPSTRNCGKVDSVPYHMLMNVSDVLQGIVEYD